MFTKILLPLDGSDLSREAMDDAAALATKTGAEVVLVQVVDSEAQLISQVSGMAVEPMPMGEVTVEAARSAVTAQRRAAEENLAQAKQSLEAQGITVSTVIRSGNPGDQIVEAADELGCDVVVMATHGRTGFRRAILGSVADHVARNTARASVLLVKPVRETD
ncbi:MAG: universal stress protein [Dehalococcoidia bacterium]|nr:universal stress protein [Dehalococcoidia bacterium]